VRRQSEGEKAARDREKNRDRIFYFFESLILHEMIAGQKK
jgi:hypothetical protein